MASEKSLLIAYLCWLFGGFFGLHHFYLGRDKHAFITFATFGGYFTLGLIRDLWRIPEYVKDANNDLEYVRKFKDQVRQNPRPPNNLVRQSGLMIMGNILSYLVQYAIPRELLTDYQVRFIEAITVPFASALGVWLVGNVGRQKGSITKPLMAAYAVAVPCLYIRIQIGTLSTLAAVAVFIRNSQQWRLKPERKKNIFTRILILSLCVALYMALWSSWLYFNCQIEDPETKEPIKCRDAIQNFFNSPAFTNLSEAIWMLVEHTRHQGLASLWREMMQEFDMSGKNNALATLELKEGATPDEILAQYKKLSRQYHPDRERDSSMKAEKQERFIQVQEAFRRLQPIIRKRESDQKSPYQSSTGAHTEL